LTINRFCDIMIKTGGKKMNDAKKQIKNILTDKDITISELADKINMKSTSLSSKLYRNTMKYNDVVALADALDCDVCIIDRATKKIY